jgi:hypothetical protein
MNSAFFYRCLVLLLPFIFVTCQDHDKQDGGKNEVVFEDRVLQVDPVRTEDVIKGIAGDWASDDNWIQLKVIDNRFSFTVTPQAQPWLIELDDLVVSLDEHMTFERGDVVYDLYWVFEEPKRMRLTAKGHGWDEVKGISLTKK